MLGFFKIWVSVYRLRLPFVTSSKPSSSIMGPCGSGGAEVSSTSIASCINTNKNAVQKSCTHIYITSIFPKPYLVFGLVFGIFRVIVFVVAIAVFVIIGRLSSWLVFARCSLLSQPGNFRMVTVNALVEHGHQVLWDLVKWLALDIKYSLCGY